MEVDDLVNRFRLASRELRNHWFHPPDWDQSEWEVVEGFDEVERLLFETLVLWPAGVQRVDYGRPNPDTIVVPRTPAPIMINRDRGAESGYWDHPGWRGRGLTRGCSCRRSRTR